MIAYKKSCAGFALIATLSSFFQVQAAELGLQDVRHPLQKPLAGIAQSLGAAATVGGSLLTGFGAKKSWELYKQFSTGDTSFGLKTKLGISAGLTTTLAGITLTAAGLTYVSHYVYKNIGKRDVTPHIDNRNTQTHTVTLCKGGLGNPEWRIGTVLPHAPARYMVPDALLLQFPLALPESSGRFLLSYANHIAAPLQDIQGLDSRLQDVTELSERPDVTNINLFAHSCGAADWATLLGRRQLPNKVKLVHLLAPFAHTDDLIDNWVPRRFGLTLINDIARFVAARIVLPKFGAIQPIDAINSMDENFNNEAPKVIVESSTGDWVVPASSAQRLATAMRAKGLDVREIIHQNRLYGGHDFFFTRASTENRTQVNRWYDEFLPPAAHPENEEAEIA